MCMQYLNSLNFGYDDIYKIKMMLGELINHSCLLYPSVW